MNAIQWGMVIPHGRPRRYFTGIRGLGQDGSGWEGDTGSGVTDTSGTTITDTSVNLPSLYDVNSGAYTGVWSSSGGASSGGGTPVSTGTGFNWNSFFNNLFGAGTKALQVYGTQQLQQQALTQQGALSAAKLQLSSAQASSLTSMFPLLLLGGGVLLLVSAMKK